MRRSKMCWDVLGGDEDGGRGYVLGSRGLLKFDRDY
jgi:hypothetical protein